MRKLLIVGAVAAMAAVPPLQAELQARGKGKGHRDTATSRTHPAHERGSRDRSSQWERRPDGSWVRSDSGIAAGNPHGCPPGLAWRNPPCVPPGQARRSFREGQRLPPNYNYYTAYDSIPQAVRDEFEIPSGYRYIYRDNVVYVVDPTTSLVRDIIDILR